MAPGICFSTTPHYSVCHTTALQGSGGGSGSQRLVSWPYTFHIGVVDTKLCVEGQLCRLPDGSKGIEDSCSFSYPNADVLISSAFCGHNTAQVGKVLNFLDVFLPDGECSFACVVEPQTLNFFYVDLQSCLPSLLIKLWVASPSCLCGVAKLRLCRLHNQCHCSPLFLSFVVSHMIQSITIKNEKGDSKHPCLTLVVMVKGSDKEPLWTTWHVDGSKAIFISLMIFSGMP